MLGVPARSDRRLPATARPTGRRARRAPSDGYVLFFGTLEPRKNVGGLLDAYEQPARRSAHATTPASLELVLAGKATERGARRGSIASRGRRCKGSSATSATSNRANRRALYDGARLLVHAVVRGGLRHPGAGGDVGRRAGRRRRSRIAAGGARRRGRARRPRSTARTSPPRIARLLDDRAYAAACVGRGIARAREFRWDRTAQRVRAAYEQAIARRRQRSRAA